MNKLANSLDFYGELPSVLSVIYSIFSSDLTLLEYSIVKFCPSLVATAVVLQANYVVRGTGWSDALEHYSGYSYEAGSFFYNNHVMSFSTWIS